MNAANLPAERPRCRRHGIYMTLRPASRQTKEQAFCGTWYDCPEPHCTTSALLASPGLMAQLETQRAA